MIKISISSFTPITTIQIAIADGLGNMVTLNTLCTFDIGNGTCHLQYTVVGACTKVQALHSHAKHVQTGLIGSQNW